MWENLEKDILFNKNYSVSLLFIENINSDTGNYSYKYSTREYDVLSDRGKLTRLKQLNSKLIQESLEEQVNSHLAEFISDVELNKASIPVITNVDAEATVEAEDFRIKMPKQIIKR